MTIQWLRNWLKVAEYHSTRNVHMTCGSQVGLTDGVLLSEHFSHLIRTWNSHSLLIWYTCSVVYHVWDKLNSSWRLVGCGATMWTMIIMCDKEFIRWCQQSIWSGTHYQMMWAKFNDLPWDSLSKLRNKKFKICAYLTLYNAMYVSWWIAQ